MFWKSEMGTRNPILCSGKWPEHNGTEPWEQWIKQEFCCFFIGSYVPVFFKINVKFISMFYDFYAMTMSLWPALNILFLKHNIYSIRFRNLKKSWVSSSDDVTRKKPTHKLINKTDQQSTVVFFKIWTFCWPFFGSRQCTMHMLIQYTYNVV